MKPMLASDWAEDKVRFPVIVQPKIDGVRGLNLFGKLTGRSLKPFKNKYATAMFSHSSLIGFDGEFAAERETHPDLCRLTTSATSTIEGEPWLLWHLFDYVTVETKTWAYEARYLALKRRVEYIRSENPILASHLQVVPSYMANTKEALDAAIAEFDRKGYEGTILRDPAGLHKSGRSTVTEGGLLRVKEFRDAELVVTRIVEGQTNTNEAKINELGYTERSSHKENMIPNGLIGNIVGNLLQDITIGDKTWAKGQEILIAPGRMTDEDASFYLLHPAEIIGKVAKFQYFPKGVKDKLRFPTFQGFRSQEDMSE